MSTRCTTHFRDNGRNVAIIYRHGDGYPDGHGTDLLAFLKECAKLWDPRLNDPSYLAAKLVVFLADAFRSPQASLLEFLFVGVVMSDPEDIEYMYTVDCGEGEWPVVKCFEVGGEEVPIPGNFTLGTIKRENRSILHPKPGRGHLYKKNCGDYVGNPGKRHFNTAREQIEAARKGLDYCGNCGLEMGLREDTCPECGYPTDEEAQKRWNKKGGRRVRGNPESSYTISRFDIGRPTIRAFGKVWLTQNFIGRILPRDVGKKVYLRGDILQVENDEQFNRRRAATGLTRFNDTPHRY